MYRILLGIFFIVCSLTILPQGVLGQQNTSTSALRIPFPGQNCGVIFIPPPPPRVGYPAPPVTALRPAEINRCCYYEPVYPIIPEPIKVIVNTPFKLPFIGNVGNPASSIFSAIWNQIVGPIFSPVNTAAKNVVQPCLSGTLSTKDHPENPACICEVPKSAATTTLRELCRNIDTRDRGAEQKRCNSCIDDGGVWTGIGCVYGDFKRFIQETVLGYGVSLAGGLALLCILYAAFSIQTSRGNPEQIKKAQELLTSCIMGLLLIIFSVFILRIIGVNLLRLPGFS